jgi:hypothetical protein
MMLRSAWPLLMTLLLVSCAHRREPAGLEVFGAFMRHCLSVAGQLFARSSTEGLSQRAPLKTDQLDAFAREAENLLGFRDKSGGETAYLAFWRQQREFSGGVRASLMTWVGEGRAQMYLERPSLLRRHSVLGEFATWSRVGRDQLWTSSWRSHNHLGQIRLELGNRAPFMIVEWRLPIDQDLASLRKQIANIAFNPLELDVVPDFGLKRFADEQSGNETYQVLVVNHLAMNERGFAIVDILLKMPTSGEVQP